MKKVFYFCLILIFVLFVGVINFSLIANTDLNHLISLDIIICLNLLIIAICMIATNKIFKKYEFSNYKNLRKEIKSSFTNSFFVSSIISIVLACAIYGGLRGFLNLIGLKNGTINYCVYASKIWFISSPFIGLEVAIFKYFETIDYWKKPVVILIVKFCLFLIISLILFKSRKFNCFLYAKPITDFILFLYYSKISFDIGLKKA